MQSESDALSSFLIFINQGGLLLVLYELPLLQYGYDGQCAGKSNWIHQREVLYTHELPYSFIQNAKPNYKCTQGPIFSKQNCGKIRQ